MKKRWIGGLCALALLFLAGCSDLDGVTGFDATLYVRGYLDEAYHGKFDPAFLKLVDSDRDAAEENYAACVDAQYDYLCYRLSIDDALLDDDVRDDWKDFLRTLLAQTRYEVSAAVRMDGDEYAVRVTIHPLSLFRDVMTDDYDDFVSTFNNGHKSLTQERLDAMTTRERNQALTDYEADWATELLKLFQERAATPVYADAQIRLVRVYPDGDQYYIMSDLDLSGLDQLILTW